MEHADQRTQIGPRYVHNTYRNVPSCPHEQRATSLRGSCQIPRIGGVIIILTIIQWL
jgi:hypothetical protein